MDRLDQLFQQFLRERTYINNVTQATLDWYECAWKAFNTAHRTSPERPSSALIAKADLQHFIVHLRERGVRPVSCNTPMPIRRVRITTITVSAPRTVEPDRRHRRW